ncbi:alpha/beta hydrolase [Isosphaeraceae bacterium EP7]
MTFSSPVEGFRLAYDRFGAGPPVVLLHGWPGDRTDYRALAPLLSDSADVIVPDLRGFGQSDKHVAEPELAYSGAAQARSIIGLIEELRLRPAVLAGYDVGSFVAQTVARLRPDLVRALVVSPPLPGAGKRVLSPESTREFWYPAFHQLYLAEILIDGKPHSVRAYLKYFWSHWSGPCYAVDPAHIDHLVNVYSPPGAFTASIAWYRTSSSPVAAYIAEAAPNLANRIKAPTTVLWQEHDPIFPTEWSDRLDEFFADVTLEKLAGVGHFTPLEAPAKFAAAIQKRLSAPMSPMR